MTPHPRNARTQHLALAQSFAKRMPERFEARGEDSGR